MISKELVKQTVDEFLVGTDYYLVDIIIGADNRISVEIDAETGVSIDFCVALNRFIESKFDRDIEDYELEVSSAGLTSPFKVLKQYEKNIRNEVEVLTKDGRKLHGILTEVNESNFTIEIEKQVKPEGAKRKTTIQENITFSYNEIKTTKYIFRFK
jgi:ribosome maturation factor RimP